MYLYVPATLDEIQTATVTASGATWTVPAGAAHAVTDAQIALTQDWDQEERELDALLAAAFDSMERLVDADASAPPLRVVVTVDVDAALVRDPDLVDDLDETSLTVPADIPDAHVVAVHIDEPKAAPVIAEVLAQYRDVDDSDEAMDALEKALDAMSELDLLWYDPTEIPFIPRA